MKKQVDNLMKMLNTAISNTFGVAISKQFNVLPMAQKNRDTFYKKTTTLLPMAIFPLLSDECRLIIIFATLFLIFCVDIANYLFYQVAIRLNERNTSKFFKHLTCNTIQNYQQKNYYLIDKLFCLYHVFICLNQIGKLEVIFFTLQFLIQIIKYIKAKRKIKKLNIK